MMQDDPQDVVNKMKNSRKRFQKDTLQEVESSISQTHISRNLKLISGMWSRLSSEIYGELFGLAVPEIRVIWALSRASGLTGSELSTNTKMDKGSTSRAVAFLVEHGILVKKDDPGDKRLVRVELTPEGHVLSREIEAVRQARQAELANALDKDEQEMLHCIFGKLERALQNAKSAADLRRETIGVSTSRQPDAELSE